MNKKSLLTTVSAMALTAALTVGGTLAYLSSVTETATNTFSSSKSISTELKETFDSKEASSYTPGKVITKAPTMKNDSKSEEAIWVAVSLDYTNGASSLTAEEFAQYAEIQGMNTANWEKVAAAEDGQELYMYKTTLAQGAVTEAIFESVKVNAGITEVKKSGTSGEIVYTYADGELVDVKDNTVIVDETKFYDKDGNELEITADDLEASLPTFEINVKGYAVQSSDVDQATAEAELIKLANSSLNITFVAE